MNGIDDEPMAPQTFLYGCVLEAGKEVIFNPEEEDDFEHQLDLRMACVDATTKDELHTVEVEGQDTEGQKIKAVLVSLKPSTLPSVCLGGFAITPPAVFRLRAGSGPVHLSGQHLIMMEADQTFDEEDDEEEEEEEEDVKTSKKRPAASPAQKSLKKRKMEMEEDDEDDDDDDDEDDDEDDEDDDDDDEEEEEEESPVKAKQTPSKQKSAQNGKGSKPDSAGRKQEKTTPKGKGEKSPKTPTTPKTPLTVPEIKAKLSETVKKGITLPKVQLKFENFVKNSYKMADSKDIAELWKWRQTVMDAK